MIGPPIISITFNHDSAIYLSCTFLRDQRVSYTCSIHKMSNTCMAIENVKTLYGMLNFFPGKPKFFEKQMSPYK